MYKLLQPSIEGMSSQRDGIAQDDELHAGTGHGYVHAAQVAEEAYLAFVVGADEADEDDIALLTLEAINGIDCHQVAVGTQGRAAAELAAQLLHLCLVG